MKGSDQNCIKKRRTSTTPTLLNNVICQRMNRRRLLLLQKKKLLLLLLLVRLRRRRRLESNRSTWAKFDVRDRIRAGQYHNLLQELRLKDHETFLSFNRMTPSQFDTLLGMIGPTLEKQTTSFREPISPGERLSITLRYLVTGDSKKSISCSYMIGYSTTGGLIQETCEAIWNILRPMFLKTPDRKDLLKISKNYWDVCKMPNCVGPLDAKKVSIQLSPFQKSSKEPNIVLFASCDTDHKFTIVDVENHESAHVSYGTTAIAQSLDTHALKLPKAAPLPGEERPTPYFFLGSIKLPLKEHTLKPYSEHKKKNPEGSQLAFNTHAERTLQVLDNTLGLMRSRFNIFKCQILAKPKNATSIVKAACCLHNFLLSDDKKLNLSPEFMYCPPGYVDSVNDEGFSVEGQWRLETGADSCFVNLPRSMGSNMYTRTASRIRDTLASYLLKNQTTEIQRMDTSE